MLQQAALTVLAAGGQNFVRRQLQVQVLLPQQLKTTFELNSKELFKKMGSN